MIKPSFIVGLLLLALVAIPMPSPAQTPAVTNGLNWLTGTQTADGTWSGVETEGFVATTTATDALLQLDPTAGSTFKGVTWLAGQAVSPTDLLARRIVALARAGRSTTTEVAQLLALRDASGGWGGDDGYPFNTLDTALALHALKVAGYQDDTLLFTSLKLLTTAQVFTSSANTSGGFAFYPGAPVSTYVTALVVQTLCL